MTRPSCGTCRRCRTAGGLIAVALACALASALPLLITMTPAWCAVTGVLLAVFLAALFWPCGSRDSSDMDALIEATREEQPQYGDWDIRELIP